MVVRGYERRVYGHETVLGFDCGDVAAAKTQMDMYAWCNSFHDLCLRAIESASWLAPASGIAGSQQIGQYGEKLPDRFDRWRTTLRVVIAASAAATDGLQGLAQ